MKNATLKSTALMLLISSGLMAQSKGENNYLSTISFGNPTCHNTTDGWITINTSPNSGPQSILWNTGQTNMSLNNLAGGTYVFTISDNAGNTLTDSVVLTTPSLIQYNEVLTNPSNSLAQNGSIIITDLMSSEFTYSWSTSDGTGLHPNTINQTGLGVGTYTFVIQREGGCSLTKEFKLSSETAVMDFNSGSVSKPTKTPISRKNLIGSSPFKGKVHIKLNEETTSIQLFNHFGLSVEIPELSNENKDLQLITMEPGYYIAVFHLENGNTESKSFKVD